MRTLRIGALILLVVLIFSLAGVDAHIFLNSHSIILVVIGTFGILAFSTPGSDLLLLCRNLIDLRKEEFSEHRIHQNLILLSNNKNKRVEAEHPLIKYSQDLWEQGLDPQMFGVLLRQKLEELNNKELQSVATMRNVSKYPPALGMTGTVIGLVSLFANLNPENKHNIGPNLALALTATFYGLLLANFLLLPLADRLHVAQMGKAQKNEHIYQILMLIEKGEPPVIIEEELNAAA